MTVKCTKRIKITATRRRTLRIEVMARDVYCPECDGNVETVSFAEAAEFLEVEIVALNQLITEGRLHLAPTINGSFRICRGSLF